eukprot:15440492-Alexandrium_andersonii.AAC.1
MLGASPQPEEAAAPARPTGRAALSAARYRRTSQTPRHADPGVGGAEQSAAPPALGTEARGSPTFAPIPGLWGGPFGKKG